MVPIELCSTKFQENDLTISKFTILHPKNCKSKSPLCAWGPCINSILEKWYDLWKEIWEFYDSKMTFYTFQDY